MMRQHATIQGCDCRSRRLSKAPDGKVSHFADPLEVPVHVDDCEAVVERGLGDEQVRDGRAVPHPVVIPAIVGDMEPAPPAVWAPGLSDTANTMSS